jgi:hypothetical protein
VVRRPRRTESTAAVDPDAQGGDETANSGWRAALHERRWKILGWIAGVVVTAWFLPALSHQWDDRQRAREVQAAIVTKIGRATTEALVTSQALVAGRLPHTRRGGFNAQAFNTIDLNWERERAEIEAQLEAYFPSSDLPSLWRDYGQFVRDTYWLATDRCYRRPETVGRIEDLRLEFESVRDPKMLHENMNVLRDPFIPDVPRCPPNQGELTTFSLPTHRKRREAYYNAARAVLRERVRITRGVLRSHLAGFSTRPRDLLSDLVPGF